MSKQRDYADTTGQAPYVENITDAATYRRRAENGV